MQFSNIFNTNSSKQTFDENKENHCVTILLNSQDMKFQEMYDITKGN